MPYALFCNEAKLSKAYPTEADVWKLAQHSGLVVDVVSDEEKPHPRPVLDNDYEIRACPADPVGSGLIERLSRPGGNATGFMMFEYNLCAKWLELFKEIAPGVTHVGVLRDPSDVFAQARMAREAFEFDA